MSPDNRLLAYAEDTIGRRQYTLRFKDLATGRTLPDAIPNVEAAVAWAADSRTVLYIEKDPQTLLGNRVRRHVLGTDPTTDPLVYEETRRELLRGRRHDQGRPVPLHLLAEHRVERAALRRRRGPGSSHSA